jgi:hypothetical protein
VLLDDHPAYRRAKERGAALEENLRAAAFLPIPEKICGIEVVPLTLRIILRLTASRSPFMIGRSIRAGHIVAFLWAVSPGYSLRTKRARESAKVRLVEKAAAIPYIRARSAIRKYLYYAWLDRPPVNRKKKGTPLPVCFAAAMVHHMAKAYGWTEETILEIPIRRLYQYLNMIRLEGNPNAVTFNPIVDRLTKPIRQKLLEADTVRPARTC